MMKTNPVDSSFIIYHLSFIFWTLRAVLRTALVPLLYTSRIECASYDGIAHTWKVFYTTTAHQHNRVLLQVVALTRDVTDDLKAIYKTNFRHLTEG